MAEDSQDIVVKVVLTQEV